MQNKYQSNRHDDNDMQYKESHFSKVAFIAGATILGIAGYKSGMFKNAASSFIKTTGNYTTHTASSIDAVRKWANMSTDMFSEMSKEVGDITGSIRHKQNYKNLKFKDLRKQSTRINFYNDLGKNLDTFFSKGRVEATKTDFNLLKKMISDNDIVYSSIKDTDLYKNNKDILNTIKKLQADGWSDAQLRSAEKQMYSDFYSKFNQSVEKSKQSIKRSGHRAATVGDIYEIKNGKLQRKVNGVQFTEGDDGQNASEFFTDLYKKVKEHKIASDDNFLNTVIDNAVLIGEDKKFSDMRGFKKSYAAFTNILSEDFKIPVIGINPLQMFGVGELGTRKYNFGALAKNSIQNTLTGKAGKDGALNRALFFSNGTVFGTSANGDVVKLKEGMSIHRVSKSSDRVDRTLEGVRKMAGLNKNSYREYQKSDGNLKYYYGKLAKKLDVGFSDISKYDIDEMGLNDILNPETYITKATSWLGERGFIRPHKGKDITKTYRQLFTTDTASEFSDDLFIAVNKTVTIDSIFEQGDNAFVPKVNGEQLKKYAEQYFASRKNLDKVTERTTNMFYSVDRVNNLMGSVGLGLSAESTTSAGGIIKNMLLKRALPAYIGYTTYQSIVAMSERTNEETGETSNLNKSIVKGIANTDLAYHKIKDVVGLTDAFKKLEELMPGSDQLFELPGINALKLTNTFEEQKDYHLNGMEPIRKSRYWGGGTQAFTGQGISYYRPSMYRRAMAEVEFSDSQYGSRREWLQNQPLPNLASPLAPFRYFISDRYHWDEKHYEDRPYMETSPMFQNVPIVGGPLSATLGKMLKPVKKMHEEYWNQDVSYTFGEERNTISGMSNIVNANAPIGNSIFRDSNVNTMIPVLYSTKSGNGTLTGIDGADLGIVNTRLRMGDSLNKVIGNTAITSIGGNTPDENITASMLKGQDSIRYNSGELYNSMNDFLGMHGFMAASVFGDANEDLTVVENSSYAYSHSRAFWNNELGGLGGTFNELTRRFLTKRAGNDNLFNPVRNTMPDWMPGSDYFVDLKHGDPYVKVPWGEGRLPGEGYERLWNIKPFELNIGSSFLGKSKEDIVRHFLHQDDITDSYLQNIVDSGTRVHGQIERQLLSSGLAIDTEQTVVDEKNGITGTYDVRMLDNTSKYGQSIMDIKTVGASAFDELTKSRTIKDEHMTQVNFYLHELGLDKGYIMYVNRDNPEDKLTLSFNYSQGLYTNTINKLHEARNDLFGKLETGEIKRGDLYSPIDRLRILGDVAPYSKEFDDMDSYMSNLSLSDSQKKEVRAIRDRVTKQRNTKRLYNYKYKDIDTMTETAMIDTLFDDGTFTVFGSDKKFKLAGVDITKNEDDPYMEDKRIKYMNELLGKGNIVKLEFDRNPEERIKGTSTKVIVHSNALDGFANVNKALLGKGYATENESEYGLDLKVKMSGLERGIGSILESITHLDTPINTKFMKVRSAKEDYERERVYGNGGFGRWSNPIQDYYKPLVLDRNIGRGTISGIVMAAIVGKMFGRKKFGMIVGATTTTAMVAGGKIYAGLYKGVTGTTWRPERVRKEQELNEYIDMLKYVKYRKLYNEYKFKAQYSNGRNGVDVDKLLLQEEKRGNFNKKRERDTNKFALNAKKAHQNGKSVVETAVFGPSTEDYNLFGLIKKGLDNVFHSADFLSSSIKDKLEYEYARRTEDYSRASNRTSEGKGLPNFKYSTARKQFLEEENDRKYKEAKASIANERKRLKGSKKVLAISGDGEYNNELTDTLMNLSALKNMLDSNNRTYIDEDIEVAMEGTGMNPIYNRKGDIDRDKMMVQVDETINNISSGLGINQDAVMALMYYKLSEQTMYAYDQGDPIMDLMKSMPKKDRDYFREFVKASEEEKLKILDLAPKYMRRPLQSAWGLTVEKKTDINEYFNNQPLPDADWDGWREDVDLDAVKVKMVKREGLEFKDNNIWEDDVKKANAISVDIPKMNVRTLSGRSTLKELLTREGYQNIQIFDSGNNTSSDTELYLSYDEKRRYKEELDKKVKQNFI